MPQSNMKRSVIMASKGDAGAKEIGAGGPSVEPQSLLGNVFQRVMNMINGNNEEEDEVTSDVEAPSIIGKAFFSSQETGQKPPTSMIA
jgi:hypothetical protein